MKVLRPTIKQSTEICTKLSYVMFCVPWRRVGFLVTQNFILAL